MKDELGGFFLVVGIVDKIGMVLKRFVFDDEYIWGIRLKNVQQIMVLEFLLCEDILFVILIGKVGIGKMFLVLVVGLLQIEDLGIYKKLVVVRLIVFVGKDIGYLLGEKEEKLKFWMQLIFDNLEFLFNVKKLGEFEVILVGIGLIQVEVLIYIRGRSILD